MSKKRKLRSPKFKKKLAKKFSLLGETDVTPKKEEKEETGRKAELDPGDVLVQIDEPLVEIKKEKTKPRRRTTKKTATAKSKPKRTRKSRKPKASTEA